MGIQPTTYSFHFCLSRFVCNDYSCLQQHVAAMSRSQPLLMPKMVARKSRASVRCCLGIALRQGALSLLEPVRVGHHCVAEDDVIGWSCAKPA